MKKIYYDEGPVIQSFGAAGLFRINEPREVQDDLAEILLRKGRLKEWPEEKPKRAGHGQAKED
jgi:hypothetical protein